MLASLAYLWCLHQTPDLGQDPGHLCCIALSSSPPSSGPSISHLSAGMLSVNIHNRQGICPAFVMDYNDLSLSLDIL